MYTYNIEVLRVIDGDTIDANIELGFDVKIKKRVRFMGSNTPESRTRDLEEKKRGLAAKARLKVLLKSKEISEDEEKKFEKKIQTLTDEQIKIVDEKVISKETEIMKI